MSVSQYQFLIEYEVPWNYQLPDNLDIGVIPGLLSCRLAEDRSQRRGRVFANWASRTLGENHSRELEKLLVIPQNPVDEWFVRKVIRRPKRRMLQLVRPGKLFYLALVHFAALFGLLATFRGYYDYFCADPLVVMDAVKPNYDIRQGSPVDATFRARNIERSGPCKLEFASISLHNPDGTTVTAFSQKLPAAWPVTFAAVATDGECTLPIQLEGVQPGKYKLTIHGRALQGRWRPPLEVTSSVPIEVWRPMVVDLVDVKPISKKRCIVNFSLSVGVPSDPGRKFLALVQRERGLKITNVSGAGVVVTWENELPNETPNQETTTLSWESPPLTAMQHYSFSLGFDSSVEHDRAQWEAIAKKISFPDTHQERLEGKKQ